MEKLISIYWILWLLINTVGLNIISEIGPPFSFLLDSSQSQLLLGQCVSKKCFDRFQSEKVLSGPAVGRSDDYLQKFNSFWKYLTKLCLQFASTEHLISFFRECCDLLSKLVAPQQGGPDGVVCDDLHKVREKN